MATLKTSIYEEITLHGNTHRLRTEKEITGITNMYHRIVTVQAGADATIFSMHDAIADDDGTVDLDAVKYLRITNRDTTNDVILNLQIEEGEADGAADSNVAIALQAGKTFMLHQPHDGISADDDAISVITDLKDLESIIVDSASSAVTLEIFIALG